MEHFAGYFAEVSDPRAENARHDFLEVVFIAVTAVLCGAEARRVIHRTGSAAR